MGGVVKGVFYVWPSRPRWGCCRWAPRLLASPPAGADSRPGERQPRARFFPRLRRSEPVLPNSLRRAACHRRALRELQVVGCRAFPGGPRAETPWRARERFVLPFPRRGGRRWTRGGATEELGSQVRAVTSTSMGQRRKNLLFSFFPPNLSVFFSTRC